MHNSLSYINLADEFSFSYNCYIDAFCIVKLTWEYVQVSYKNNKTNFKYLVTKTSCLQIVWIG